MYSRSESLKEVNPLFRKSKINKKNHSKSKINQKESQSQNKSKKKSKFQETKCHFHIFLNYSLLEYTLIRIISSPTYWCMLHQFLHCVHAKNKWITVNHQFLLHSIIIIFQSAYQYFTFDTQYFLCYSMLLETYSIHWLDNFLKRVSGVPFKKCRLLTATTISLLPWTFWEKYSWKFEDMGFVSKDFIPFDSY